MTARAEREAFEEWCYERWGELRGRMEVRLDGTYISGPVQFAWCEWQAARMAKGEAQELAANVEKDA